MQQEESPVPMIFPYDYPNPLDQLTRFNFGALAIMMLSWITFVPAAILTTINIAGARHRVKGLLIPLFGIVVTVILVGLGAIMLYISDDGAALLANLQRPDDQLFAEPEVALAQTTYDAIGNHLVIIFTLALMTLVSSLWSWRVHIQVSRQTQRVSSVVPPEAKEFTHKPNL
jgi:hypothetical protein